MSGLLGYSACYDAMHKADLLLLLGTDFPYDAFLPQARTIQIDRDYARLGRGTPLELAVHGDVGATLRAVLPLVEQKSSRSFLDHMLREHARALEHVVDAYTHDIEQHLPIHPEYAAQILTTSPSTTPSSPSTPACTTSGPRATSPPTAAGA
jgi:pyruvate dehydrogenase (quinone)